MKNLKDIRLGKKAVIAIVGIAAIAGVSGITEVEYGGGYSNGYSPNLAPVNSAYPTYPTYPTSAPSYPTAYPSTTNNYNPQSSYSNFNQRMNASEIRHQDALNMIRGN